MEYPQALLDRITFKTTILDDLLQFTLPRGKKKLMRHTSGELLKCSEAGCQNMRKVPNLTDRRQSPYSYCTVHFNLRVYESRRRKQDAEKKRVSK